MMETFLPVQKQQDGQNCGLLAVAKYLNQKRK